MTVPTQALHSFGIPAEDIAALEVVFGPMLPLCCMSPEHVFRWSFQVLPWTNIHPILRSWLASHVFPSIKLKPTDFRYQAVMDTLCDRPDLVLTSNTVRKVLATGEREAQRRGVGTVDVKEALPDPDYPCEVKAWWASSAAARAALAHVCEDGDDEDVAVIGRYVGLWALSICDEGKREFMVADMCKTTLAAVCTFVKSWAPPALEMN